MGVPFFCILLGFPLGWYIVRSITLNSLPVQSVLRRVLVFSLVAAAFTLLVMLVIWAPVATFLFDPTRDLANIGIPMILYEPLPSFIGWIVLMILISPFLQLLTTLFSSYLTLLYWMDKKAFN